MTPLLLATLLLAPAAAIQGQAGGKPLPPNAHVRSAVNMFIELHNHLEAASRSAEDVLPEYRSEVKAYREAKELAKDPRVWQVVNDACIAGPDIAAIGKVTDRLPADLAAPDQEAVRKIVGALKSAWPRFDANERVERHRSLQSIWTRILMRHWGLVEERLLTTLYDRFAFAPIDGTITVYPVIDPVALGAWGRTATGYYVILPVSRVPNLMILEEVLHEVTHVLDDRQPAGSKSLLSRLRQQGSSADKEALERFTEGLVAFNSGEFIRRFVSADYRPSFDASPDEPAAAYLPTYQGPWIAYLEGKISADQAIEGMVSALKPAAAPAPAKSGF